MAYFRVHALIKIEAILAKGQPYNYFIQHDACYKHSVKPCKRPIYWQRECHYITSSNILRQAYHDILFIRNLVGNFFLHRFFDTVLIPDLKLSSIKTSTEMPKSAVFKFAEHCQNVICCNLPLMALNIATFGLSAMPQFTSPSVCSFSCDFEITVNALVMSSFGPWRAGWLPSSKYLQRQK